MEKVEQDEWFNCREAVEFFKQRGLKVSHQAIRKWTKKFGVGEKRRKHTMFKKKQLKQIADGKYTYTITKKIDVEKFKRRFVEAENE